MPEKTASTLSLLQHVQAWHNVLTKVTLFLFGFALWIPGLSLPISILLVLMWLLEGGVGRLRSMIKDPFISAIFMLCGLLALGTLWGDYPDSEYLKWKRYFAFLFFIPFLSLLNKARLPWAISGVLSGYFSVLWVGFYQWLIVGVQGIPPLRISYLTFSSMLGIGIILTVYFASINSDKKIKSALWCLGAFLLFFQFNQDARGPLLATLLSTGLLIFLLYKTKIRILVGITSTVIVMILAFAFSSTSFKERLIQVQHDFELYQQQKYDTSIGYRLAIWDVGLHGIMQQPLLGYGTGKAGSYFDETIKSYKNGSYKDLPQFHKTSSYHNDWIEIGMHVGLLGLVALACLLGGWFQAMRACQLPNLGATLVGFVFLSGLTDTFVLYSKIPTLLLIITAIAINWQKSIGLNNLQACKPS